MGGVAEEEFFEFCDLAGKKRRFFEFKIALSFLTKPCPEAKAETLLTGGGEGPAGVPGDFEFGIFLDVTAAGGGIEILDRNEPAPIVFQRVIEAVGDAGVAVKACIEVEEFAEGTRDGNDGMGEKLVFNFLGFGSDDERVDGEVEVADDAAIEFLVWNTHGDRRPV